MFLDSKTGIITFSLVSGATKTIDTLLEKTAINFDFDAETQKMIIYLEDGTTKEIDLSAFIKPNEFLESGTIAWTIDSQNRVTAIVKEGSIEEKHLRPNYLADIKVEAAKAESSASSAENSANQAGISADRAEQAAATAGWADFDINDKGHLIFTKTDNLETEFALSPNGRLEVTLV